MKAFKSIIKAIDRLIPFKETGIILLLILISLIIIESIWDGSISSFLNMNHVVMAVAILAFLMAVALIIKYARRGKGPCIINSSRDVEPERRGKEEFAKKPARAAKWRALAGMVICVTIFLGFSLHHLGQFETVDEPKWLSDGGRVDQIYTAIGSGNWSQTIINDKPGIVPAYLSGTFVATHNISDYNYETVENYYFWARFPIVIFNALMLIIIYLLLRSVFNNFIAFASTLGISLSPTIVGYSQVVNPDAVVWSLSFIAILGYFSLLKHGGRRFIFLTGIALGLASLSKYSCEFIYCFLFVFALFQSISTCKDSRELKTMLGKNYLDISKIWLTALITILALYPATWSSGSLLFETAFWNHLSRPLIFIPVVLIADTLLLRSLLARLVYRYKSLIFTVISAAFLLLLLLSLLDIIGNYSLFNLNNSLAGAAEDLNFFQLAVFNAHQFLLSLPLIVVMLLLIFLLQSYRRSRISIASCFMLVILFFILGSAFEDQKAGARYQVILFPIYLTLSAIGLYWLCRSIKKKLARYAPSLLYIVFIIVPMIGTIPYYYTYTNSLNYRDYAINEAWGMGGYELAQQANELLPDHSMVWSDKEGFKTFYKGPACFRGVCPNPFDPSINADYLVLTYGGEMIYTGAERKSRYGMVAANTPLMELYASNESMLAIYLNGNKNNYVRLIEMPGQ